jgi:hypothetical protein
MSARGPRRRLSRRMSTWEDRLGSEAVLGYEWTIRLYVAASGFTMLGLLTFVLASNRDVGPVGDLVMWTAGITAVVLFLGAIISARRTVRLVLDRYGLPPDFAATLKPKTINDTREFDKWLADCQSREAKRPTPPEWGP